MAKKTISLVLAVIMVLSMFAINAFAAGETATFTVTSSAAEVATDDVITITVTAASDSTYYAGPMSIPVTYDATAFEYVANSVTVNDIFGAGVTDSAVNTTAGKITVAVTPLTNGSPVAPNLTTALTVFTFQLKALSGEGDYTIGIAADQKTAENPTGKFYCGSFSTSDPKTADLATIGQTLNRVDATVSFASAEPELILTATGESNGVIIDTHKTFGGQYAGVVYGFPQAAAATFRSIGYITTNLTTTAGPIVAGNLARTIGTAGYGTGTTITVGSKVYVIVIFGDANGDGLINNQDTTAVKGFVAAPASIAANSVQRMAANCQQVNNGTMLHTLNNQDTTALKQYVANAANKFSPATLASYQNSKNNFYQ